ncbi:hypothetical protein OGAPHI_001122 [Ogataea philodendri]|uniref:Uncharacterized protein n=1 Tax=Ogataea philodendri TaxID=1378263 RepID=A0A9P8PEM2_9ASCO|nr:uncharacterized protein OGAPHI_001122 [Ogataea philodendri]KAH3670607.1 hypothetical protein OGAPHI_001122 [Ogataea philodendri]
MMLSVSLIPAVSPIMTLYPLMSRGTSMESRVVPSISLTIARSSFAMMFNNDDLPAFGGPVRVILNPSSKIWDRLTLSRYVLTSVSSCFISDSARSKSSPISSMSCSSPKSINVVIKA